MINKQNRLVVFKAPIGCGQCGKMTNTSKEYSTHMKYVHQEDAYYFECDQCKFMSYDKNEVEGHMISKGHKKLQTISEKKQPCVQCPLCSEEVPYGMDFVEHVNVAHVDKNATAEIVEDNEEINVYYDDSENPEDEIQVSYDDEEDEEFSLPPQFTTKVTCNDTQTTMVTFKSVQKSMLSAKATTNLAKMIRKSTKIGIKTTQLEVVTFKKKDNTVEATIKVTDKEVEGNARLQIWGPKPNNKRNCTTVLVSKMEGHNAEFVEKLANNIIKPLLEHLLVNVDAKGLLGEGDQKPKTNVAAKDNIRSKMQQKAQPKDNLLSQCDTCGIGLKTERSLRRHKRDDHIENQPLGGAKRTHENQTMNLLNPRLNDSTASPPTKLRVVPEAQEKVQEHDRGAKKVQFVEEKKEPEIVIEKVDEQKDYMNERITALEKTIQLMKEQKDESDKINKILQEDLIKANEYIAKSFEEKGSAPEKETEEFLTDSEEEKVQRNKHRGRGFLKARRTVKPPKAQMFNCTTCEECFETETDLTNHAESHENEVTILARSRLNGYRRTDPMSSPKAPKVAPVKQKVDTLCHMCGLRCETAIKLTTHMKNHSENDKTYDMSSIQKEITASFQSTEIATKYTCRKCKNTFLDETTLKKHLKDEHKSYRPCNKFSPVNSEDKCSYKDKCDFSHAVLKPGTMLCWDCGNIFTSKNYLMLHRKNTHNISIICKKVNTQAGCDREEDDCWYLHTLENKSHSSQVHNTAQNVTEIELQQDFPVAPQHRAIPINVTTAAHNNPTKMETILINMIGSIAEQNQTMMEMILNLQSNQ